MSVAAFLLVYALLLAHEWASFNVVQRGGVLVTAPLVVGLALFALMSRGGGARR